MGRQITMFNQLDIGANLAAEEQGALQKSLIEAILAIQLSFYIFETPKLRGVLIQLCPNFIWPKQQIIATIAIQLYFKCKQELIKEIYLFTDGTYINPAIDCFTMKDQSQTHIAMVAQWIGSLRFLLSFKLITFHLYRLFFAFELINWGDIILKILNGAHTGQALAWSLWESLSK
ncbi:hypothetical protein O181_012015 [Austropuccinia psidii MF-1]|uniref:Uncharacterized protein n=1 Tax=Austropuccinia psidii MF-1 TaxID=1389203 RepID=A0A9Q3GMH4_9BASI|nr:hypothetical protein [Austropuccinia psidii MF-1]